MRQQHAGEGHDTFRLSDDPGKAMREMMSMIDALRNLYDQENQALAAGNIAGFMALQDSKNDTTQRCRAGAKQLVQRRAEMERLPATLREQAKAQQEAFATMREANLKALGRAQRGVARLGNRIMNIARNAARQEGVKYGASGGLEEYNKRVSIGVDESA